jgi:hypothetical protein
VVVVVVVVVVDVEGKSRLRNKVDDVDDLRKVDPPGPINTSPGSSGAKKSKPKAVHPRLLFSLAKFWKCV